MRYHSCIMIAAYTIGAVLMGWLSFRLIGEVVCRFLARRWFGSPEPGSMRLFGKGKRRPIQSFESLAAPNISSLNDEFKRRTALKKNVCKHRSEWAAMSDGLIVGSAHMLPPSQPRLKLIRFSRICLLRWTSPALAESAQSI